MADLVNTVIESFEKLEIEDKEFVFDLLKKQLVEIRREKISERAKEAYENYLKGDVKKGTLKELFEDLEK